MGGVNSHHYLDDFLAQGAECCEVKSKVSERHQVRISVVIYMELWTAPPNRSGLAPQRFHICCLHPEILLKEYYLHILEV